MKIITLSTAEKYKRNAKRDRDIPMDVLKIRLNCLVDATDREHISTRGNSKVYQFGSCLLYVTNNMITDIRWTTDRTETPTDHEQRKLVKLYIINGLNKRGNKFADNVNKITN